jgi:sugar phosphate isomerase/epimerase
MKTFPIGVSTFCVLFSSWRQAVELLLAEGCEAIELFGDAPQAHFAALDGDDRRELKLLTRGCELSLHAPTFEINIASANPGARAEAVRQYREAVRLAADIGATRVVVHEGHMSYWKLSRADARQAAVDGLRQVLESARQEGVTIALENTNFGKFAMLDTWQEWLALARDLNDPALRLTLDTGHAQIAGWNIPEVIRALAPQIAQIHISDNHGSMDDHLILGDGVVDWTALAQTVRETGCRATWILEAGPLASVEELRTARMRMEGWARG